MIPGAYSKEENDTEVAKHIQPIEDTGFHIDSLGNLKTIDEIPSELGNNETVYSCEHHDPCLLKYHANRTYYKAYRPRLFILCYKSDYCLELACPENYLWDSTLGYCLEQEGCFFISNNIKLLTIILLS